MIEYILDSTALIALVGLESGSQRVAELLENSAVSALNLAETANKLLEKGFTAAEVKSVSGEVETEDRRLVRRNGISKRGV
jgi:PIN domain nuclease of toxin-antitoxin system